MRRFTSLALATAAIGLATGPLLADNHGGMKGPHKHHAMMGDGHVPMYAEDLLAAYYPPRIRQL